MSDRTKIEWADATWNPLRGCSRVSEGCRNCYAERTAARFSGPGLPYEGLATKDPPRWTGDVRLIEDKIGDPLRWRKPRRVFVNSVSDLFHEAVPDAWIDEVFAVMALSPQHTFQVLTKRPERMRRYLKDESQERRDARGAAAARLRPDTPLESLQWPLPNAWIGVSVEDQETADHRIPYLLDTPAATRFVSAEPLLAPVNFRQIRTSLVEINALNGDHGVQRPLAGRSDLRIDWIIVGGESGPGARPFDIRWATEIVADCRDYGVACFVKQLGSRPVRAHGLGGHITPGVPMTEIMLEDRKGGDPSEWPEDLRVREFPTCPPSRT